MRQEPREVFGELRRMALVHARNNQRRRGDGRQFVEALERAVVADRGCRGDALRIRTELSSAG